MNIENIKVCTAVPTISWHFEYAASLVRSHNKYSDCDIYLIFSSENEKQLFSNIHKDLIYKCIIIETPIGYNPITYKKFNAVNFLLSNGYDYVAILDDESEIVKCIDIKLEYSKIANCKYYKGNKIYNKQIQNTVKNVASVMGYENDQHLLEQTENFEQYWWFNDTCVYSKDFFEFFDWYNNHQNLGIMQIGFEYFDYLMYSIWMIVNKKYTIKKYMEGYSFNGAAIESNWDNEEISKNFMSIGDRNINHRDIEHIKIQIMIDRDFNHCNMTNGKIKVYEA